MSVNIDKTKLYQGMSPGAVFTQDVHLLWLLFAGKAEWLIQTAPTSGYVDTLVTTDDYADKAIETIYFWLGGVDTGIMHPTSARRVVPETLGGNFYGATSQTVGSTDFRLYKLVNDATTLLGSETVDVSDWQRFTVKVGCIGTTIKAYRIDMTTPKISVTDSAHASGRFGCGGFGRTWIDAIDSHNFPFFNPFHMYLRAQSSPNPQSLAYFEAPIIGEGTEKNPYRADLPEDAVSHSALIPTDSSGKPTSSTAIVRVFADTTPQPKTIEQRIQIFTERKGCTKLTREQAISKCLEKDDKLHMHDLTPCTTHPEDPKSKCCKEYINWREKTIGVKRDLIDDKLMAKHIKETKW